MTVESEDRNGTRWPRVFAVLLPVLLVVGGIGLSIGKGVLAASVVAQSTDATLVTAGLRGDGVGLIIAANPTKNPDGTVGSTFVRRVGVGKAIANGLCLAQPVKVMGMTYTVLITAGDKDPSTYEIALDGVVLNATYVKGYVGTTGNAQVNKNAADVQVAGSSISLDGASDSFGLQAQKIDLRDISANVQNIDVPNTLAAPGFTVKVARGTQQCPSPPTGAQPGGR
ncbi:DUF6230 family protein [Antrihabitans cavernicola]|uniref:Cholesterol esterase n=1 Tax=Antrihabitans cavernicola TaxID=2495913 RepID=A0A5A7SD38_9NOCA|nr:DUF6230 family protein [Spelaeibacter cavernicola]KAA0023826.1 hypothetical protein FOY51_04305 [Spelaeibacter cavernicola]